MISRILVGAQLMGACAWLLYLGLGFLLLCPLIWPQYSLSIIRDFGGLIGIH